MGRAVATDEVFLRTVSEVDGFNVALQIVNSASVVDIANSSQDEKLSVIDTDVSLEAPEVNFFEQIDNLLNAAHEIQKRIFFGLLTPEFLKRFKPEY